MTLVISALGSDYVVLGADRRGTTLDPFGNRVELNIYRKIIQFNERVSILLHGEASAATYLLEGARRGGGGVRNVTVSQLARKLYELGTKQMRESPPSTWKVLPQFGMIIAGLDRGAGGRPVPRCIGISSTDGFWPHSYDQFAIKGKPLIANYLFARRFDPSMVVNDMTKLVAQALYDTMNVDGDVGGDFDIVIIDDEGTRPILTRDFPDLIEAWGRPLLYLSSPPTAPP